MKMAGLLRNEKISSFCNGLVVFWRWKFFLNFGYAGEFAVILDYFSIHVRLTPQTVVCPEWSKQKMFVHSVQTPVC